MNITTDRGVPRRFYISAPVQLHEQASKLAKGIVKAGGVVVSRWHDAQGIGYDGDVPGGTKEEMKLRLRNCASADIVDLNAADRFIYLSPFKSGGAAAELGFVLAQGPEYPFTGDAPCEGRVMIVGRYLSVFHYHHDVEMVEVLPEPADNSDEYELNAKAPSYWDALVDGARRELEI